MGSSHSSRRRRRRMSSSLDHTPSQRPVDHRSSHSRNNDTSEVEDPRESEQNNSDVNTNADVRSDLPSILAYLIRSGQLRILTQGARRDSCDSDEDSFCEETRPPLVDPNPDTSMIKKNDIYEEILLRSGRSSVQDKSHPTVPHMLCKRQVGMDSRIRFGAGHRRVMGTPFLPNSIDIMACYRQKAFCGTYAKEGNIFLSAAQDQNIRIYDTKDGNFDIMKTIRARDVGWSVLDTAFSPDGNYMIYSSWSECIHLCNVYGEEDVHQSLHIFPSETSFCIFSLTFSSDNREILGGANDGNLYVYDRDRNERSLRLDAHDDDVNAVAFADSTSQILFSGGDDGLIKIWDRRTLTEHDPVPVGILAGHYDGITYIDPKGDGRYLLSNSKDQTMKLWDIRVMSSQSAAERTKKAVSKQGWDYRWQQVPKKMYQKRKLEGDTSVMVYKGHSVLHTLIRCHFSPEFSTGQRYVYTGCATGSLVIYDTLTGNIVRKLEGHRSCVRDVSWHPYENNIMSASWDGTLGKWEYHSPEAYDDIDYNWTSSDSDDDGFFLRRSRRLRKKCKKKGKGKLSCKFMKQRSRGLFD